MNYTNKKRGFYRSRYGLLFGVCRGIAERFGISVFWTRAALVVAPIFTGFWPVGAAYLLLAVLMKREPAPWKAAVYACPTGVGKERASRCDSDTLDMRLRRMQSAMNRDMRNWDARLYGNRP